MSNAIPTAGIYEIHPPRHAGLDPASIAMRPHDKDSYAAQARRWMPGRARHDVASGFTLVELSIVLVIIGLIIGGVLTGRQILQNAEITNALNGIQAFEAQFQTYVQNYGAIPGDDASATTRFPNSNIPSGDNSGALGNNILEGNFDSLTAADETRLAWAELRAADLVKQVSGTDQTVQPANPFGGIYGFQHGAFGAGGIAANVVCLSAVPADAALAIDNRLDDGISNSGAIQATVTTAAPGAANATASTTGYVQGQTYTVCIKM